MSVANYQDFNKHDAGGDPATFAANLDGNNVLTPVVAAAAPVDLLDATLSLDTNAYASGDVLADTQEVTGAFRVAGGRAILESVTVVDEDDQGAALTLWFLRDDKAMGTENSAPNISDADARDVLGFVEIATGDYKDLGGVKVATVRNVGLVLAAAADSTSLFVAAVNGSGTPTYTAAGLKLRLGVSRN